jgi:hypothetical protein
MASDISKVPEVGEPDRDLNSHPVNHDPALDLLGFKEEEFDLQFDHALSQTRQVARAALAKAQAEITEGTIPQGEVPQAVIDAFVAFDEVLHRIVETCEQDPAQVVQARNLMVAINVATADLWGEFPAFASIYHQYLRDALTNAAGEAASGHPVFQRVADTLRLRLIDQLYQFCEMVFEQQSAMQPGNIGGILRPGMQRNLRRKSYEDARQEVMVMLTNHGFTDAEERLRASGFIAEYE